MNGTTDKRRMESSQIMVNVEHLTKRYAGKTAVEDLSFQVNRGEILGFLGPNGAGKTTTLRILSGFLCPTGGKVTINGCSLRDEPMELRRQIGYMPEQVPLYTEMRIQEYLAYRANLKGMSGSHKKRRIQEVLEQFGLTEDRRRIIGKLSKGMKQRVGLADAMLHEPPVLLLDEPSIGLDPNQIREVRQLIRDLAGRHTVILSSHILPEVEMVSTRILIVHQGKMVASDSTRNLKHANRDERRVRLEVDRLTKDGVKRLLALNGIRGGDVLELPDGWFRFELSTDPANDPRTDLYAFCFTEGWTLRELRRDASSLEDTFIRLTHGGNLE